MSAALVTLASLVLVIGVLLSVVLVIRTRHVKLVKIGLRLRRIFALDMKIENTEELKKPSERQRLANPKHPQKTNEGC